MASGRVTSADHTAAKGVITDPKPRGRQNPGVLGVGGLRVLRLANPLVRRVLDSPAHRALSGQLLVLAYRGSRTGQEHRIPLRYAETPAGEIVVLALEPEGKQWWRSFAAPRGATITFRGARLTVEGVLSEGQMRRQALAAYTARFRVGSGLAATAAVVVFTRHG
jgi:hypothetical protein